MSKLARNLWLAFGITLLGWQGWAMLGIGVVLLFIGFLVKAWWEDRQIEKRRKEREQ